MKRKGASGSPWRTPVSILKTSVFPSGVMTRAEVFSYITLIAATISGGIPYEERIFNIFSFSIDRIKCLLKVDEDDNCFFLVVL